MTANVRSNVSTCEIEQQQMVTRKDRLSEFATEGTPTTDLSMELLCEDSSGTYVLPFRCKWIDGFWHNGHTNQLIEGRVVGWRAWD